MFATFDEEGKPTGFYTPDIHGDAIPASAVEIGDDDYRTFLAEQGRWTYVGGQRVPAPVVPVDCTERNIAALWQSAHDYEYQQISGSAIGLLALSVAAGRSKAVAVQSWLHSIWALYYARKAAVGSAPINAAELDFSECGIMPHTVPELMEEAGFTAA